MNASSVSDSSLAVGERSMGTPWAASSAKRASDRESASPTRRAGRRPSATALSQPPSAATTSSTSRSQSGQPTHSAARFGTSPSATISARMAACRRSPKGLSRESARSVPMPPLRPSLCARKHLHRIRQRCSVLDSLRRHDPDQVPRVCGSSSTLSAPPRRSPVCVQLSVDFTPAPGTLASPVAFRWGSCNPKRGLRRIEYGSRGNQRGPSGVIKSRDRLLPLFDSISPADTIKVNQVEHMVDL